MLIWIYSLLLFNRKKLFIKLVFDWEMSRNQLSKNEPHFTGVFPAKMTIFLDEKRIFTNKKMWTALYKTWKVQPIFTGRIDKNNAHFFATAFILTHMYMKNVLSTVANEMKTEIRFVYLICSIRIAIHSIDAYWK